MKMITYKDVQKSDLNYEYFIGDTYTLMRNAGKCVADEILREFGRGRRILTVCGTGNNAGDGLVASSILSASNDVSVFLVKGEGSIKTKDASKALELFKGNFISKSEFDAALEKSEVVIDAIFGSGFEGNPRAPYDSIITKINGSGKKIVSVDVPSALGSDIPVKPLMTVTFTDAKVGMDASNSGKIVIADIGIPDKVFRYAGPGNFVYYRLPAADSHKGMNGLVGMVTGWTYYGSAVISALGAIKSGADLVRVYVTDYNRIIISSYDPQIIVRELSDDTLSGIGENNSILIGPGLGKHQDLQPVLLRLKGFKGVVVVDADGLDLIETIRKDLSDSRIIITPHQGEFRRISGTEPTLENAITFSKKLNVIVILKGVEDLVVYKDRVTRVQGGNPRMTMGGTGDLLAGLTAAISTRSEDVFESACMASFLNKSIGDLAMKEGSYWYDINDMIEKIPLALKTLLRI